VSCLAKVKRTTSCALGRVHSATSSPWSLEWVNRQKHFAEVMVSMKSNVINKSSFSSAPRVSKKKSGGYLRNCAQNLKHIARLFDKDRKEIVRALRRTSKQRREVSDVSKAKVISNEGSSHSDSQSSVNNDWKNWLVLHGNDKVIVDDVWGIGKEVRLKFKGIKIICLMCCLGPKEKIKRVVGRGSRP